MEDREDPREPSDPPSTDDNGPRSSISAGEFYDRIQAGERVSVLDVRDRDEFDAWRVDGPDVRAVQVPHVEFIRAEVTDSAAALAAEYDLESPVVVVCARGEASDHAATLLRESGVDALNLAGGMDAWARLYVDTELGTSGETAFSTTGGRSVDLTVRQYVRPSSGCLAYLVYGGDEAVLVDPLRVFADRYVEDVRDLGLEIVAVVDTHVHADHLSGLREVAERVNAPAYLPDGATERGVAFDAVLLEDGDGIEVGGATVDAMHVPGHTSEMTALRVNDVLLSGDSIFVESVARPDLEAGDEGALALAGQLYESLHGRILELPDDTVVAPGHVGPRTAPTDDGTYAARLGDLREQLPLLGLDRDEFVARVVDDLPPRPANFEVIVEANLGRREVDEEAGFELELGPNNCAVSA